MTGGRQRVFNALKVALPTAVKPGLTSRNRATLGTCECNALPLCPGCRYHTP
jgi:hypothetical protein